MTTSVQEILARHGIKVADDELAHIGVKGMRWGVRKGDRSSGGHSSKPSHPKKPDVKAMSDEELKARIARIKMEKEFAKLTAPELSPGRKFVTDVIRTAGKQAVQSYANKAATQGADLLYEHLANTVKSQSAKKAVMLAIEAPKR